MHPKIKFTMEKEVNNKINFLDLYIANTHNKLLLAIYTKPTTTDLIIHNDSCHLHEHKEIAVNFLVNRVNKYPIAQEKKNEETIVKTILNNNNYPQNTIQQKQKPQKRNNGKKKRTTFTFFWPETRTVTKLLKNTEIGIRYRTRNNIKHPLRVKENKGKYNQIGVYQL
jgi:hypothetical protein